MAFSDPNNEFKLENGPTEEISSVKFGVSVNSKQFLLASSWDCTVRLYDATNNAMRLKCSHSAPVLDCCFQDVVHGWSATMDNQVKLYDFNSNSETVIGTHDAGVRCIEYCPEVNVAISGSWDKTVRLWDSRTARTSGSFSQPDKVYAMAVCGDKLIVGTAGRCVLVWDLRMGYVQQRKESSLKHQTRCICTFPNKQGYVLSSVDGRVAVEYLGPSPEVQKKKYAFRCHCVKENGLDYGCPVNAISFHSGYNTFATGGSDGYVKVWDGFNKKCLCQFHRYPTGISSLAFSPDGTILAIASSSSFPYATSEFKEIPSNAIFIRQVTDEEIKPLKMKRE